MMHFKSSVAAALAALSFAGMAHAQNTPTPAPAAAAAAAADADMATGEVRKIDKENNKLTVKHGPLKSLDMPGMTMVFVAEPAILDKVKVGQKIRFKAEKVNDDLAITQVE